MIASGEASVAVAAFRVGYSPAHFSSAFRKRFGIPPSALR
jgi:AraC family transcriptional activator of pyochelin receptor